MRAHACLTEETKYQGLRIAREDSCLMLWHRAKMTGPTSWNTSWRWTFLIGVAQSLRRQRGSQSHETSGKLTMDPLVLASRQSVFAEPGLLIYSLNAVFLRSWGG